MLMYEASMRTPGAEVERRASVSASSRVIAHFGAAGDSSGQAVPEVWFRLEVDASVKERC